MDIHFHTYTPVKSKMVKEPLLTLRNEAFVPPKDSPIRIGPKLYTVQSIGYRASSLGLDAIVILGHCPFENVEGL